MFDSYNPAVLNEAIQKGAGGGGGTAVVANPEGAATADLTKLGVGETIYGIPAPVDYSTTEFDTGIKWVDGSEIYGKVIPVTTIAQLDVTVDHGITGIDKIIQLFGTVEYDEDTIALPYGGSGTYTASLNMDTTRVLINFGNSFDYTKFSNCNVIAYYTKTASQAKKSSKKK